MKNKENNNYINKNKEAWEEVFEKRTEGSGNDVSSNLQNKFDYYIEPAIKTVLDELDLTNKNIGQFCCNNSCELLLISKHYNANGVEFDIPENFANAVKWKKEYFKPSLWFCSMWHIRDKQ